VDTENVQVPHWAEVEEVDPRYKNHKIFEKGSKVFGSFEDELEEMNADTNEQTKFVFYCLQKKTWLYAVDDDVKYRFKGLNDKCILLNNNVKNVAKPKPKAKAEALTLYKFYNNNSSSSIGNNQVKLFEEVYNNKGAFVLCPSFRKVVKNSLRNVDIDETDRHNKNMNKIQVSYTVKYININDEKEESIIKKNNKMIQEMKYSIMNSL
jgi:hypothetical protein